MGTSLSEPGALPAQYKGTRGHILLELKRAQPLTAKELAARMGVSLNAIRHHLRELETEGVVEYLRMHRAAGAGAPAFAYRLSPAGNDLFPQRYRQALTGLLDQVVEREGRAAAVAMLEAHFEAIRRQLRERLQGVPAARRMEVVARTLADEGYMAEWHEAASGAGGGTLREHNCAIHAVAERFPEICAAEQRLLEEVLGAPVNRRAHILSGCTACEYEVRAPAVPEADGLVQIAPRPQGGGQD